VNRSLRVLLVLDAETDASGWSRHCTAPATNRSTAASRPPRPCGSAAFTDWDLVLADSAQGDLTYASVLREIRRTAVTCR